MSRIQIAVTTCLFCCGSAFTEVSIGSEMTIYTSTCQQARKCPALRLPCPCRRHRWKATVAQRRQMWHEMLDFRHARTHAAQGCRDRRSGARRLRGREDPFPMHARRIRDREPVSSGEGHRRLPAVLYLCGHSKGKVNAPYQANPRWFGQHGYVALVLDPIQLGESQGIHHERIVRSAGIGRAGATRRRAPKCGTPCGRWTTWRPEPTWTRNGWV